MKNFVVLSAFMAVFCLSSFTSAAVELSDMHLGCVEKTFGQIKVELGASMNYMAMASYFSQDKINLPGFAKFFFNAATEEREHAYKLIEYLSMRGEYEDRTNLKMEELFNIVDIVKNANEFAVDKDFKSKLESNKVGGLDALKTALKMEKSVTASIRDLIQTCEKDPMNHYHFVDYLTGEFLEEQYKGQREIAGKISTLEKMSKKSASTDKHRKNLSEFLFDKEL